MGRKSGPKVVAALAAAGLVSLALCWFLIESERGSERSSSSPARTRGAPTGILNGDNNGGGGDHRADATFERFSRARAVDYSDHSGLGRLRIGGPIVDLADGAHLDALLLDCPEVLLPPVLLLLYDSSKGTQDACAQAISHTRTKLISARPAGAQGRAKLFAAQADVRSFEKRAWYQTTNAMELVSRLPGLGKGFCVSAAIIPPECGHSFDTCKHIKVWQHDKSNESFDKFLDAVDQLVQRPVQVAPSLRSAAEQGRWLLERERATSLMYLRNIFQPPLLPALTERGFTSMTIPNPLYEVLISFYAEHDKRQGARGFEQRQTVDTRMNYYEIETSVIDVSTLDQDGKVLQAIEQHLLPLVSRWANIDETLLQVAWIEGINEYPDGLWMHNHVTQAAETMLSVAISLGKADSRKAQAQPWALEAVDWNGEHVAIPFPMRTMVLYEGQKLPLGLPARNEGGMHLALTVTFTFKQGSGLDAKWRALTQRAQQMLDKWIILEQPMDDHEKEMLWELAARDVRVFDRDHHAPEAKAPKPVSTPQQVTFKNHALRDLDLYWSSKATGSKPVLQAQMRPSMHFVVSTFVGHAFFFSERGSLEPIQWIEIEPGQEVAKCQLALNGKQRPAESALLQNVQNAYVEELRAFASKRNTQDEDDGFFVQFKNSAISRTLDIFWLPPNSADPPVHQKKLVPGNVYSVSTYEGHRFRIQDHNTKEELETHVMKRGRWMIKFEKEANGRIRPKSPLAKSIAELYIQELEAFAALSSSK